MKELWRILKSRFIKESDEDWIRKRREVCRVCEFNSFNRNSWTFKQKTYKYLSDFYTWLTRANNEDLGECICGCNIFYLTKIAESACTAKEEYGDDKWKSIYIPNSSKNKNGKRK